MTKIEWLFIGIALITAFLSVKLLKFDSTKLSTKKTKLSRKKNNLLLVSFFRTVYILFNYRVIFKVVFKKLKILLTSCKNIKIIRLRNRKKFFNKINNKKTFDVQPINTPCELIKSKINATYNSSISKVEEFDNIHSYTKSQSDLFKETKISSYKKIILPIERLVFKLKDNPFNFPSIIGKSITDLISNNDLNEDLWKSVEKILLLADVGPITTKSIINILNDHISTKNNRYSSLDVYKVLHEILISELTPGLDRSIKALPNNNTPAIILVVGVNGTGKTTTVGKLANILTSNGRNVILGATDTFRAAAAEQLSIWAIRSKSKIVKGLNGADPASIAFNAIDAGIKHYADAVIIDTAGRLHTKVGLMDELSKIKRVIEKISCLSEILLVIDANIGQNSLLQAKVFTEIVGITGIVLTKLDGTAKGGVVFRLQKEFNLPIKLVGLGEGLNDLIPFNPTFFVDALLGKN